MLLGIAIHTFHDIQWPNPSQDNGSIIFVRQNTHQPSGLLWRPAAPRPMKAPDFTQNIVPFGSPPSLHSQVTPMETHHNISPPSKISASMRIFTPSRRCSASYTSTKQLLEHNSCSNPQVSWSSGQGNGWHCSR